MSGAQEEGILDLEAVLERGRFSRRHLGSHHHGIAEMLGTVGCSSLEELIDRTVPSEIRLTRTLDLPVRGDGGGGP